MNTKKFPTKLNSNEASLWLFDYSQIMPSEDLLSNEERLYAASMGNELTKKQFIAARGELRLLLSHFLEKDPHSIELTLSPLGKPQLAERYQNHIHFNLSHSHDLIAIALTTAGNIGVDIECRKQPLDATLLKRKIFKSDQEISIEDLLLLWTAKEAIYKAIGGLPNQSLNGIDVSITEGKVTLREIDREPIANVWTLHTITGQPDEYVGVVAIQCPHVELKTYSTR